MARFTETCITPLASPEAGQRIIGDHDQGGLGIRVTLGSQSFLFRAGWAVVLKLASFYSD